MDTEFGQALRYIFVLSFLLIVLAYFAGANQLLSTGGTVLGSLGNTFTGRNAQGQFAAYPSNAPS